MACVLGIRLGAARARHRSGKRGARLGGGTRRRLRGRDRGRGGKRVDRGHIRRLRRRRRHNRRLRVNDRRGWRW
nr:hypothetical protein GCM10020093_065300 [Planobispora longispora]